jgi:hypothetical protein
MARATNLTPRRAYQLDAETILFGLVKAGPRGRAAETRTGAARLLNTNLAAQNVVRIAGFGQSSTSAGGYLVQAAHVAEGAAIGTASTYATIGVISFTAGQINEVTLSGKQIRDAVKAAGSLTGDIRVVAIRLTAGTGSNGAAVPAGTNTVALCPAE